MSNLSLVEFAERYFSDKEYKIHPYQKQWLERIEKIQEKGGRLIFCPPRIGRNTIMKVLNEYNKETENGISTDPAN